MEENQNNIGEVISSQSNPNIPLVEAFLFHYGEPVGIQKIIHALEISEKECKEAIAELTQIFAKNPNSAFCVIETNNEIQLATKPEFQSARKSIIEEEWKSELTPAGQETLTIVAYLGPISKMMVDYIRGVNSGFTLRNLLIRGLVDRETSAQRKNSFDYRVSFDFLRHMSITCIEELPEYEKYHKLLEEFSVDSENNGEKPEEKIDLIPAVSL